MMPRRLRLPTSFSFLAISFLIALFCIHCNLGDSGQDEVLTIAVRADISGVFPNPPMQFEASTLDVNSNVFEGLVRFGKNMNPEPAIAESWENTDDYTWLFKLRKGVRFSNGDLVKPTDVAASINAALERPFPTATYLQAIRSARVASSDRVEIKTHYPYPILLSQLTVGFVVPEKALREKPIPAIGTGPYSIEHWTPGKELSLVRNRNFRGPASAFRKIRFVVEPIGQKRIQAVLEKKAQIAEYIPLAEIEKLQSVREIKVISRPGVRVLFLTFRMDRPPFSDVRLRQAVELSIDRDELIRRALSGKAKPASQLVPPQVAGYNPEITIPKTNRTLARKLIAEAGYPNGFKIELNGTKDRYVNDVEILHEVARQLATVGIAVTVNSMPKSRFLPLLVSGKSDFTLVGFSCDTLYASLALDTMMRSPRPGGTSNQNFQRIADAELDKLIDEAWREPNIKTRADIYAKAMKRISELHAIVPLEIQPETIAISRKIQWEPPTTFALRVYDAEFAR